MANGNGKAFQVTSADYAWFCVYSINPRSTLHPVYLEALRKCGPGAPPFIYEEGRGPGTCLRSACLLPGLFLMRGPWLLMREYIFGERGGGLGLGLGTNSEEHTCPLIPGTP